MLIPNRRQALPARENANSLPLPCTTLRNGRLDCNGIRTSAPYRLRLPHRPMSALLLEYGLLSHAGVDSHDIGLRCRRH
jgi:hypothetical protein